MTDHLVIHYRFLLDDGTASEFEVRLDPKSLLNVTPPPKQLPRWARLSFHQAEA